MNDTLTNPITGDRWTRLAEHQPKFGSHPSITPAYQLPRTDQSYPDSLITDSGTPVRSFLFEAVGNALFAILVGQAQAMSCGEQSRMVTIDSGWTFGSAMCRIANRYPLADFIEPITLTWNPIAYRAREAAMQYSETCDADN